MMALSPGTQIGPYQIVDQIGSGGMGEVYRATDTKLGRDIAIKTLPSALAQDPERLARFEREAKLLATLNHAHIGAIYGLDEHEGTQFIAMELVEGQTLAEKLKDGPLPIETGLQIGLQVAEALEAAHQKGVVHRDLKPANIMLTPDGVVKVLDFGLAKAFSGDPNEASLAHSPALSLAMTQQGLILGTAGYMSPEQASGQATDQRADIWAFGVVLYEMLTGLPLFSGESVPHVLADILKTEPDWSRLPKNVDPRLKRLLARCLQKKPRSRYHSIADARIDVEELLNDPDGVKPASGAGATTAERSNLRWAAVSAALAAAIVGGLAWAVWPIAESEPLNRFDYDLPQGQLLRALGQQVLSLSPDGRHFVYNTAEGIYLRDMDELEARLIPETDFNLATPTFSPDGQTVAFWTFGQLMRITVSGGTPLVIAAVPAGILGMSWADDDMIYFSTDDGIYRVAATGGTPDLLIPAEDGRNFYGPQRLPDGDSLLFGSAPGPNWDASQTVVQSLSTNERSVLFEGGSDARYLPSGHIVYSLGNGLFVRAFDLDSSFVGGAVPVLQGVMRSSTGSTAATDYSVSNDGTLIYMVGNVAVPERVLVWVDRDDGQETAIAAAPRAYTYPRLSPNGKTIALDVRDRDLDIWTWDIDQETLTRLTFSPDQDEFPTWSPDGKRLALNSAAGTAGTVGGSKLSWRAADGTGQAQLIAESDGQLYPASFLPDGTGILVRSNASGSDDISLVRLSDDGNEVVPLIATSFDELNPEISPDGHWLAYTSNESGDFEIYVRPFPDLESGHWQISTDGGTHPAWSRDGTELFYRDGDELMAVAVRTEPTFTRGNPKVLIKGQYFAAAGDRTYDVSLDNERFLMIKEIKDASSTAQIIIVQNWLDELERLAPTDE